MLIRLGVTCRLSFGKFGSADGRRLNWISRKKATLYLEVQADAHSGPHMKHRGEQFYREHLTMTDVSTVVTKTPPAKPPHKRGSLRDEQGGTFRILVGIHLADGPAGCDCDSCYNSNGKNHVYEAYDAYHGRLRRLKQVPAEQDKYTNDIIACEQDLERRCNDRGSRKFERLGSGGPSVPAAGLVAQPPAPYPLDKMSVAQLIAVAEEEEIELKGASQKETIIRLLRTGGYKS